MMLPLASLRVEAAATGLNEAVDGDDPLAEADAAVWKRRRERFLARCLAEEGRPMEAPPSQPQTPEATQQTRPSEPNRRSASAVVRAALASEAWPPCSGDTVPVGRQRARVTSPPAGDGGACAGCCDGPPSRGGTARGDARPKAAAAVLAPGELQPKAHAATAATRRRWFKVVAAVQRPCRVAPRGHRGGATRTGRRYVDIMDGCTEFVVARTSTHCDGSLSGLRELHDDDGFLVHRTEVQALAEDIPLDAKLLYAPRALLEVVTGGRRRRSTHGGARFFQIMPLCVIAEGRAFGKMYEEYFGDTYVYPVPFAVAP